MHGKGHSQPQQPGGGDDCVGEGVLSCQVAGGPEHGQEPVRTYPDHVVDGGGAEGHVEGDDNLRTWYIDVSFN